MSSAPEKDFSFDNFTVDAAKRALFRNGARVPLKPKTFELLLTLVEKHGLILSKQELLDLVWKDRFIEESNLTVHIAALRKALGEKKGDCRFIVTVPNEGYKFVGSPSANPHSQAIVENHKKMTAVVEENRGRGESKSPLPKRIALLTISILIAATMLTGYWYFRVKPTIAVVSLAVLPFENASGNENLEYLSDGLAENLIYALSKTRDLRMVSRTSTFRYKGQKVDARAIGRELNVDAIVTGMVSERGEDLVVTVEMISTIDDSVLWGEQFIRKGAELSKLQSAISQSISEKLRREIGNTQPWQTESSLAYERYLQGRYLLNKRTSESIRQSIEVFEQAIEEDPNYAQAYEGLAVAHKAYEHNNYWPRDIAEEHRRKCKAALLKALELDPMLAEARATLAMNKAEYDWDFLGAENEFRRAIESNPNVAIVRQWYSQILARLHRYDEALAEMKRAHEMDPFARSVRVNLGRAYRDAGLYDEAIVELNRLIEHDPDYPWSYVILAELYERLGKYADAIEPIFKARTILGLETEHSAKSRADIQRRALASNGLSGYFRAGLQYELEYHKRGRTFAIAVAAIYARLGDREMAFEWLEREFNEGSRSGMTYLKDDAFAAIADDRRYRDLLGRVGLPP